MTIPTYQLRPVEPGDFAEFKKWWAHWNHATFEPDELSSLGLTGVDADGTKLCAVWLFYTNSKFAIIDWGVTNPNAPLRTRAVALVAAYDRLRKLATEQGFRFVVSFSGSRGLTRALVDLGFKKNPQAQDSLFYSTKGVE